MDASTLATVKTALLGLTTIEDVNEVIKMLVALRNQLALWSKMSFSVGDQVAFQGNGRYPGRQVGTVIKIGRGRSLTVKTDGGVTWTVDASLLEKVD